MFKFQKLEVYKKAKNFHRECAALIRQNEFDRHVDWQLGRASFSVVLNIAEGSGKFSKADRKNFFTISRASLFECVAALDILHDEEKITDEELTRYMKQSEELSRMLYAMIKNLSSN